MNDFTHIDKDGNAVMVDVGAKDTTRREACAGGKISMSAQCFDAVVNGAVKKGDVLTVAQIAGITAAKQTSRIIPLCHNINLTHIKVTFETIPDENEISAYCTVKCDGKTGVEMEALTGVSAALLTIYDMCKAVDKSMVISDIRLLKKTGGKSGQYVREGEN